MKIKFKKLLACCLALAMLISTMPMNAFAVEEQDSNTQQLSDITAETGESEELDSASDPCTTTTDCILSLDHEGACEVEAKVEEDPIQTTELCIATENCTLLLNHEGECEVEAKEESVPSSKLCTETEDCSLLLGHEGKCVVEDTPTTGDAQETKTITAITELDGEVANQIHPLGTTEEEITATFPVELEVTIEEEVTIPVTWESDKTFSTETANNYTYTANFGDVYTLDDDTVILPQINVEVKAENSLPTPLATNVLVTGANWVLDADGKLTITGNTGMTSWVDDGLSANKESVLHNVEFYQNYFIHEDRCGSLCTRPPRAADQPLDERHVGLAILRPLC